MILEVLGVLVVLLLIMFIERVLVGLFVLVLGGVVLRMVLWLLWLHLLVVLGVGHCLMAMVTGFRISSMTLIR